MAYMHAVWVQASVEKHRSGWGFTSEAYLAVVSRSCAMGREGALLYSVDRLTFMLWGERVPGVVLRLAEIVQCSAGHPMSGHR